MSDALDVLDQVGKWKSSGKGVAIATVIIDRVIGLIGLIWLVTLIGGAFWALGLLPAIAGTDNARAIIVLEAIVLTAAGLTLGSLFFWLLLGCLSQDRADRLACWLAGRNPLEKVSNPPQGTTPKLRTTNPGRLRFSLPKP